MKVLMKKDLKKVGKKGEVVEVSDGYGANYVIPQGYGVLFTEQAKKAYAREVEIEKQEEAKRVLEAQKLAEKLKGIVLEFEAPAGRRGEMIGNISFKEMTLYSSVCLSNRINPFSRLPNQRMESPSANIG